MQGEGHVVERAAALRVVVGLSGQPSPGDEDRARRELDEAGLGPVRILSTVGASAQNNVSTTASVTVRPPTRDRLNAALEAGQRVLARHTNFHAVMTFATPLAGDCRARPAIAPPRVVALHD